MKVDLVMGRLIPLARMLAVTQGNDPNALEKLYTCHQIWCSFFNSDTVFDFIHGRNVRDHGGANSARS